MSEDASAQTSNQDGSSTSGDTSAANDEKAFTQAEVNALLAKQKRDFAPIKAKADQLDVLTEASKSNEQRLTEKVTGLETDLGDARAEAMRLRVAVEHGISLEDADLFLTGKDEETLRAQAKRLSDREVDRRKNGNHVPREGNNPQPTNDPMRDFARNLFNVGE